MGKNGFGDVREGAVPKIAVEAVGTEEVICQVEIWPSVVVMYMPWICLFSRKAFSIFSFSSHINFGSSGAG